MRPFDNISIDFSFVVWQVLSRYTFKFHEYNFKFSVSLTKESGSILKYSEIKK